VGDPFDRPCSTCEGIGRVTARAWLDWVETYRRIEFGIADPMTRLAALVGHMREGSDPLPIPQRACPECDGRGRVLTEPGRELVEFLRQRLPELIERRLRDIRTSAAPTDDAGGQPPHLRSV
jgi:hypothetical protein